MNRRRFLCLPDYEWERIKRQSQTQDLVDDYLKKRNENNIKLIERSQEWVKTWPNSVQAQVANYEAKKKEKRQRDIETVKAQREKEKNRVRVDIEAMRKARQMIFNDSCYGRELLSALRYSKDREEREKQIEFKQFMKEEAAKHDKALDDKIAAMENNLYNFGSRDQERRARLREIDKELREHNKTISELKKVKMKEEESTEKLGALEDAKLMKQLLDFEAHETDHCKDIIAAEMAQFKADDKKVREDSRKRDDIDNALIDVWKRHDDRVKCKTKKVLEEIHQEKHNKPYMKQCYETLRMALDKKEKQYNDFIDKGVQKYMEKCAKEEEREKLEEVNRKAKLIELAKEYKNAIKESDVLEYWRKCVCERYSILPQKKVCKVCKGEAKKGIDERPSFLRESTTLRDALNKRAAEPTPWNALEPSHKHFAEQTEAILKECKHKEMARKVVDNYRKTNCLNEDKLPIANYKPMNTTNITYGGTCTK